METAGGGFLGRVAERVLGWLALAAIVALGVAVWRMAPETRQAIWNTIWACTVWAVIAAALPWVSRLFIGRVVMAGTNWAPFALLAGLCLIDVAVALALMTGWPGGFWAWLGALAALGLAGTYNFLVTEYLAERASG